MFFMVKVKDAKFYLKQANTFRRLSEEHEEERARNTSENPQLQNQWYHLAILSSNKAIYYQNLAIVELLEKGLVNKLKID